MDITIETAVVALVALVTAVAALGIATGQVEALTNWGDSQTSSSNCELLKTQYLSCQADRGDLTAEDCDVPEGERNCLGTQN